MSAKLTAEERAVLQVCSELMNAISTRPDPPAWRVWEVRDLDELRQHGPVYEPARWFSNGTPLPERHRVRYLRAVHALRDRGLVETTHGAGGRLRNVKLTDLGRAALEAGQQC